MRGSTAILALAALVLILGATSLWAQDTYALPLDHSINPGRTLIKFDTRIYTFTSESTFTAHFEKIDATRVKVTIKPVNQVAPHEEVYVQWGTFLAAPLLIDSSGGDTFILHSETGYAEK